MTTLAAKPVRAGVAATGVRFTETMIYIALSDGREIGLPLSLPWLGWLARATPEQRARRSLEPRGFAVYWEELDNGIEIAPLLTPQPV
jgi:uncharacterized protein DUF2442